MKAPPSQISSWCRSTYQCLISSQMALNRDYKFCFAVTPISARSAQCLIFKVTVARPLFRFLCSTLLSLSLVSASLPPSDADGHNRVYLRAGLDHLSGHRGKQEARWHSTLNLPQRGRRACVMGLMLVWARREILPNLSRWLRWQIKVVDKGARLQLEIFACHWRTSRY